MRSFFLSGLILSLLYLVSCSAEGPSKSKDPNQAGLFSRALKRTPTVGSYTVSSKEIPFVVSASGKCEASNKFEAKAPADTKIEKFFVEEGSRVQAGDPLVKFNDEERRLKLDKWKAEIREAEAGKTDIDYQIKNKEQLLEAGKMTPVEAEELDEKANLYEATITRAKAEIELEEGMEDLVQLNSPIAGTVMKKEGSEGTEVTEGESLIDVYQLSPIYFVFDVTVEAVVALEKEPEISLKFPALPKREFTGEILNTNAAVNEQTNGVRLKIKIPNTEFSLKDGMQGQVTIHTQALKKVSLVPEAAISRSEHSTFVYKIGGNKIKKVPVELGETSGNQVIVEKGITEGDHLVETVSPDLSDGTTVEVK